MRIVSKKAVKTTHLAFLTCLIFTLFSCSQLETSSKSSVQFQFSAPRSVSSLAGQEAVFIDVSLQDDKDFVKSDSKEIKDDDVISFTFNDIPVGKQIRAAAQIYIMYESEKLYLYSGISDSITIQQENNLIQLRLDVEYNSIVESASAFIVLRPLFNLERENSQLSTNKLEFINAAGSDNDNESFSYKYNKLENFQKARVTFKGASLPADSESKLRFRLVKSTTGARYNLETKTVTSAPETYEFEIPQQINLNTIAIENDWNIAINDWAQDFSCYIDKIELIQDFSLVDPDFNKITKTDKTCLIKNPPVQNFVSTRIDKNIITFDSTQGRYDTGSGYSAAYWEFEDLEDYDKITIKVKADNPNNFDQIKIIVKGFSPFNYPSKTECQTGTDIQQTLESAETSQTFTLYTRSLQQGLNNSDAASTEGAVPLTAILFQNDSYTGEWLENPPDGISADANLNYGNPWQLEIEEILLEKMGSYLINITVAGSNDIEVFSSDITNAENKVTGKRFTAPEGYTSYIWKVDGQVQTSVTGNVFDFDMSDLITGHIYDITLLASNETFNHSWNAQVQKE